MSVSVALFMYNYSTSGAAYSGGRYHALLLGHALAEAGARVSFVVDSIPASARDMEDITSARVTYIVNRGFNPSLIHEQFDYVVVAPTGAFCPEYYDCAFQVAARSNATKVLINYESANWFNSLVPTPDYLEVWDYWRRVVVNGGIVLSSTFESDRFARDFYYADGQDLHFNVCYPPINSAVADRVPEQVRDGSVVVFVRPFHDHKGGADILALPPRAFAGRTFRVVFGGEIDASYLDALESRVKASAGASLEVYSRISDYEKFELLKRAKAVLFPTRFEGFGYPAVEAAYAGAEVVCYRLPVLVETVGEIAHMAPVGDTETLADELLKAVSLPPREVVLQGAVANKVRFDCVATRADQLLQSWSSSGPGATGPTRPLQRYTILWGPWRVEDVDREWDGETVTDYAPWPAIGNVQGELPDDRVAIRIVIWAKGQIAESILGSSSGPIHPDRIAPTISSGNWTRYELQFAMPTTRLDTVLQLRSYDDAGRSLHTLQQLLVRRTSDFA